jgi:uncharacterized membrane protein
MATLSVWKFNDSEAALDVARRLDELRKKDLLQIQDAAVVSWPTGAKQPEIKQAFSEKAAGAVGGAFLGLILGIAFLVPIVGAAFGAAIGLATGALRDFGIDDDFIETIREKVTPGTSALLLLTSGAHREEVKAELGPIGAELISTNLPVEDEDELRRLFSS